MFCGVTATSVKRPGRSSAGSGMDARTRPEMSCSLCSVDERDAADELTTQRSPSAASISNAVTSSKPASTPARLAIRPDRSPTTSSRRSFRSPTMKRPDTASYARPTAVKTRRRKAQWPGSSRRGLCRRLGRRRLRCWRFYLGRVGFGRSGFAAGDASRTRVLVGAAAVVGGQPSAAPARMRAASLPGPCSLHQPAGFRSSWLRTPASLAAPARAEVVARRRVGDDTHRRQALQHHERVARPPAQALRSRQQRHQRRIVLRPRLQRPPRQVMERVVVLARRGVERQLAALLPPFAVL